MGFRSAIKRSMLADANESRDWRIWSDLAAVLIRRARKLHAGDSLGVDSDNTVFALDSSSVDLCRSLFDWVPFRSTKSAIKLHTLLYLHGAIPALIRISDGKIDDVTVLNMLAFEPGAFYVMDRGVPGLQPLDVGLRWAVSLPTQAVTPAPGRSHVGVRRRLKLALLNTETKLVSHPRP